VIRESTIAFKVSLPTRGMRSGCREEGRGGEGRRKEVMGEDISTDD
jgi:hypothetical protein